MTYRWVAGVCLALVLLDRLFRAPNRARPRYYAEGNAALDKKQYPEAILGYRNAIKIDPRFGEARYKLAQALLASGDLANAAREYVRAAELLPENLDAHLNAARYLLLGREFEQARHARRPRRPDRAEERRRPHPARAARSPASRTCRRR